MGEPCEREREFSQISSYRRSSLGHHRPPHLERPVKSSDCGQEPAARGHRTLSFGGIRERDWLVKKPALNHQVICLVSQSEPSLGPMNAWNRVGRVGSTRPRQDRMDTFQWKESGSPLYYDHPRSISQSRPAKEAGHCFFALRRDDM